MAVRQVPVAASRTGASAWRAGARKQPQSLRSDDGSQLPWSPDAGRGGGRVEASPATTLRLCPARPPCSRQACRLTRPAHRPPALMALSPHLWPPVRIPQRLPQPCPVRARPPPPPRSPSPGRARPPASRSALGWAQAPSVRDCPGSLAPAVCGNVAVAAPLPTRTSSAFSWEAMVCAVKFSRQFSTGVFVKICFLLSFV